MAIDIQNWDMDTLTYAVVPESICDIRANAAIEDVKANSESGGWSKQRTIRKAGEIPFEFLYNYYIKNCSNTKEIPLEKFYNDDNCIMQKRLLNEFPVFRIGEKFETNKYRGIVIP